MKDLPAPLLALLSGREIILTLLIKMEFTSTVYVTTAGEDIVWDSQTWLGNRSGTINGIEDQGGEIKGLTFTLNGVDPSTISMALQEGVRGRPVTVYLALLDPDTFAVVSPDIIWKGFADQMSVTEDGTTAAVSVTAEHSGVVMQRPHPFKYTSIDQEREFPGDISLQFINSIAMHKDVWPAAAWFKK